MPQPDTGSYLGIACNDLSRDAFQVPGTMNPDKLFDYLEGRLSQGERAALEEQLMSDKQLQRQLAAARQIHGGLLGHCLVVLLLPEPDVTVQGRKMAARV